MWSIEALFIITKKQKQPQCPSIAEETVSCVYAMDRHSATESSRTALIDAAMWMCSKQMLGRRGQVQKATLRVIACVQNVQNKPIRRDRKWVGGFRD